jgi:glycosyl transferase family 25
MEDAEQIMRKGVISCTLNHFLIYEKIVENNYRYTLIFEDDVLFLGNFQKKMDRISRELNNLKKGFIVSIENTTLRFPSFWETRKNVFLYEALRGRATCGYIVDYEGAYQMLTDLKSNKCPTQIDAWHNLLAKRNVIKIYWAHPPLVEQGSLNGKFHGPVSSKQQSLIRRFRWVIQKTFKITVSRLFRQKYILPLSEDRNQNNQN